MNKIADGLKEKEERMVSVVALQSFTDGDNTWNFKHDYPAEWKAGERRTIPEKMFLTYSQSGRVHLAFAEGTEWESRIMPRVQHDWKEPCQEKRARLEKVYASEPWVECVSLRGTHDTPHRDGEFVMEFDIVQQPLGMHIEELRKLPCSLVTKLVAFGNVTTKEEDIESARKSPYQAAYQSAVIFYNQEQAEKRAQHEREQNEN